MNATAHVTSSCFFEPLASKRTVHITQTRTAIDWAHEIQNLVDNQYGAAEKIVLVMDYLNTHCPASLYKAFPPAEAQRLSKKLEIHYTPKHGSWLNMAEIELSILSRQCLNRRIADAETIEKETKAWEEPRNATSTPMNWRFTTDNARIKLKKLYPTLNS